MDLSKAFDCLPHDIVLSKLSAYGLCADFIELLKSYLYGRKQQIKLNNIVSSWSEIKKGGGPQGSILGPRLFNVFINFFFFFFFFFFFVFVFFFFYADKPFLLVLQILMN